MHKDVASLKIWNFLTHSWEESLQDVKDKHIYSGNIETIATKEKSKFPQHFFPEVGLMQFIKLCSYSYYILFSVNGPEKVLCEPDGKSMAPSSI